MPSVRIVRATVDFWMMLPINGIFSAIQSTMNAPVLFFLISLIISMKATGVTPSTHQYVANQSLALSSRMVMSGSSTSKPSKIFLNFGMMKIMMPETMMIATLITAIG